MFYINIQKIGSDEFYYSIDHMSVCPKPVIVSGQNKLSNKWSLFMQSINAQFESTCLL